MPPPAPKPAPVAAPAPTGGIFGDDSDSDDAALPVAAITVSPSLGLAKPIEYEKGAYAMYEDKVNDTWVRVRIVKAHIDDPEDAYYTITLPGGREKQTVPGRLRDATADEEATVEAKTSGGGGGGGGLFGDDSGSADDAPAAAPVAASGGGGLFDDDDGGFLPDDSADLFASTGGGSGGGGLFGSDSDSDGGGLFG